MTLQIQVPSDVLLASAAPSLCAAVSTYSISKDITCDYLSSSRTIRIVNAFTLLTTDLYD